MALTRKQLEERLATEVVIFDGAMGTELYRRHFFVNTCYEALCLQSPSTVRAIHRDYAQAGADVLTTNSFAANENKLAAHGWAERAQEINRAAAQLAREVAGDRLWVAGSVGPLGEIPFGREVPEEQRTEWIRRQVAALLDGGVDFILFETLGGSTDVERAGRVMADFPDVPYVISVTVDRHGESSRGEPLARILQPLVTARVPPVAIGLNCGEGPESMLSALEILMSLTAYPVIVQPNAGTPKPVEGRLIYMTSPEYLATYAQRYIQLGARGVGGCCGTTPDHIRELARSVRPLARRHAADRGHSRRRRRAQGDRPGRRRHHQCGQHQALFCAHHGCGNH